MKMYKYQYDTSQWGTLETRFSEVKPRGPWVFQVEEVEVLPVGVVEDLRAQNAALKAHLSAIEQKIEEMRYEMLNEASIHG